MQQGFLVLLTVLCMLQAEQRARVEEYKRQREDEKLMREHQEAVKERAEAEQRRQLVVERLRFQQRVSAVKFIHSV